MPFGLFFKRFVIQAFQALQVGFSNVSSASRERKNAFSTSAFQALWWAWPRSARTWLRPRGAKCRTLPARTVLDFPTDVISWQKTRRGRCVIAIAPSVQRLVQLARRMQLAIFSLFQAMMRHDGTFFSKTVDMLCFLFKVAQRNEKRKIGIHMPGILKHFI